MQPVISPAKLSRSMAACSWIKIWRGGDLSPLSSSLMNSNYFQKRASLQIQSGDKSPHSKIARRFLAALLALAAFILQIPVSAQDARELEQERAGSNKLK